MFHPITAIFMLPLCTLWTELWESYLEKHKRPEARGTAIWWGRRSTRELKTAVPYWFQGCSDRLLEAECAVDAIVGTRRNLWLLPYIKQMKAGELLCSWLWLSRSSLADSVEGEFTIATRLSLYCTVYTVTWQFKNDSQEPYPFQIMLTFNLHGQKDLHN